MSRRSASAYLIAMAVLMVVVVAVSLGRGRLYDTLLTLLYGLLLPGVLAICGVLIVRRHPANRIGQLFLVFAPFHSLIELAEGYGRYARDMGLSDGVWAEWVLTWSWIVDTAIWVLIFLLFPDGRLVSWRWRPIVWIGGAGTALALPGQALGPYSAALYSDGTNPLAVRSGIVDLLYPAGIGLLLIALLGAVASLGVRLHRARGVERQQLKWFVAAATLFVAMAPIALAVWNTNQDLIAFPLALAICSIPVAATVAILRYRLYDIDVVINRTLVYAALTATLAAAYLASVLLLQLALRPLTDRSDLAVAGSTLAVAALFRPARTRIQGFVARRFYRSRYDAARTLAAFGDRLRDEVDIGALQGDVYAVVRQALQPAHASLWLRDAEPRP